MPDDRREDVAVPAGLLMKLIDVLEANHKETAGLRAELSELKADVERNTEVAKRLHSIVANGLSDLIKDHSRYWAWVARILGWGSALATTVFGAWLIKSIVT